MAGFDLIQTLTLTLREPRRGMAQVLALPLGQGERLGFLLLLAILNVLSAEVFAAQMPELPDAVMAEILQRPFVFAALQLGVLLVMAGLVHGVGRLLGGRGDAGGAQLVVLWLQTIFFVLQLAQVAAMALFPPLTLLIGLASLAAGLWYLPHFIAELHGFASVGRTFLGMVATMVLLSLVLVLALALFVGSEVPNV
jgi:Yip1 domain